jgi:hypothetical protein
MKRWRFIAAALIGLTLLGNAATATAQPAPPGPGNSAAAHACQDGGWQNLVTSTGATFANQDDCVAYAGHGGVLAPKPTATLTIAQSPWSDPRYPGYCAELTTGTGLLPGSTVEYTTQYGSFTGEIPVAADGTYSDASLGRVNIPGVTMYATGTRADGTPIQSNTVTC